MHCPRCNRITDVSVCSECGMTEKEAEIYEEGWNSCLSYIKRLLPQERKLNIKRRKNE